MGGNILKKGQLSDNTVHMLLTIVIIVIIVLIVSFMFPKFSKPFADEINSVRKDVFGIGVSEMEEGEEEKAINSFEEVVKAFEETSKGNVGCVSSLKSIPKFSENYFITIQKSGKNTKLSLYDKSNLMPKTDDIDNPIVINDVHPCVMENSVAEVKDYSSFIIRYGSVPYIDRTFNKWAFYNNFPVLYKRDKKVCFITDLIEHFDFKSRNKKYFEQLPSCSKELSKDTKG